MRSQPEGFGPWVHNTDRRLLALERRGASSGGGGGTPGPPGAPGSVIYAGNGQPSNATGIDGDWYIDQVGAVMYGPKTGGVWPATGIDLGGGGGGGGAGVVEGNGPPTTATLPVGSFYLDLDCEGTTPPSTPGLYQPTYTPTY